MYDYKSLIDYILIESRVILGENFIIPDTFYLIIFSLDVLPAYVCCYVLPIEASELFDY
jgi:hypothetical protein